MAGSMLLRFGCVSWLCGWVEAEKLNPCVMVRWEIEVVIRLSLKLGTGMARPSLLVLEVDDGWGWFVLAE